MFTKMLDRGKHDKDAALIKCVEEATDLWSQMMLEEHVHDQKCVHNINALQEDCGTFLKELLSVLHQMGNSNVVKEPVDAATSEKDPKNVNSVTSAGCDENEQEMASRSAWQKGKGDVQSLQAELQLLRAALSESNMSSSAKDDKVAEFKQKTEELLDTLTTQLTGVRDELSCALNAIIAKDAEIEKMNQNFLSSASVPAKDRGTDISTEASTTPEDFNFQLDSAKQLIEDLKSKNIDFEVKCKSLDERLVKSAATDVAAEDQALEAGEVQHLEEQVAEKTDVFEAPKITRSAPPISELQRKSVSPIKEETEFLSVVTAETHEIASVRSNTDEQLIDVHALKASEGN